MITTKVYGTVYSQSGQVLPNAVVKAILTAAEVDVETGIMIPAEMIATTDESGYFEILLWPNARGRNASQYDIQAAGRGWLARITVPEIESVNVTDIISQAPYPSRDAAQVALESAQLSAAEATAAASAAAESATATAADRAQTGLDVVATAADREQTGLDAAATAADRTQTGLDVVATAADRIQTGLDAQNSANSASAADISAGLAAASAGAIPAAVLQVATNLIRTQEMIATHHAFT